jgi:glycosyltransferase involved in cell wall biosynthesis
LLFPVGDADGLASHLRKLHADPQTGRQLAENAIKWLHAQDLTWDKAAEKHAAVYREVVVEYCRGKGLCAV